MAKYRLGSQAHYRLGLYTRPGEVVTLPDSELPSLLWEPLDDAAKAAIDALKKLKTTGKIPDGFVAGPPKLVVEESKPAEKSTLSELAKDDAAKLAVEPPKAGDGKKPAEKRPSDKSI